jgi:hypothetical protein
LENVKGFQPKFNPIQNGFRIFSPFGITIIRKIMELKNRLVLASSQLLWNILKILGQQRGRISRFSFGFLCSIKSGFPIVILVNHWQNHQWIIWILVYLFFRNCFYIPTLIFCLLIYFQNHVRTKVYVVAFL